MLGAGRLRKEDRVDPAVGVTLHHKVGARVGRGEPLATLWYNDQRRLTGALPLVDGAFVIGARAARAAPLVIQRITR